MVEAMFLAPSPLTFIHGNQKDGPPKNAAHKKGGKGGFHCPGCQSAMSVIDSRWRDRAVRRRRYCLACGLRVTTKEVVVDQYMDRCDTSVGHA